MLFVELPVRLALGKIAVHTVRLESGSIKKGTVLIEQDIDALVSAGIETVYAAEAEAGEISEDDAVDRIADRIVGTAVERSRAAKGRCNLYAARDGLLQYDSERLDGANAAEPTLNILALRNGEVVRAGQLIAQVKAIPYLIPGPAVDRMMHLAAPDGPLFNVRAFRPVRCGLLQTRLPGTRESVLDKTRAVLAGKLQSWQAGFQSEQRCPHTVPGVREALARLAAEPCGMILVVGATAATDTRDIVPEAIRQLGGSVTQIGVPLEPGTMLSIGGLGDDRPVLLLPGSLRSPVDSSFDVIAPMFLTGLRPSVPELRRLGAGGLLKAVPPEVRDPKRSRPGGGARIAAVVLAAGLARRMGDANKLLVAIDGQALISHALDAVLATPVDPVIVVVGHDAERLRPLLARDRVSVIENPDYAEGISSSLRAGIGALADNVDGALVCLGDMPFLSGADLDQIIAAYEIGGAHHICVPVHDGRQGNPVLWGREYFGPIKLLRGDHGAKMLLAAYAEAVVTVPMDTPAILRDVDTPGDLPRSAR